MDGYLSLKERKEIVETIDEYVEGFMPIYWGGNYILLIGNYQAAIGCYQYMIDRQMGSAEIYNNLGLAYLMESKKRMPSSMLKNYLLPLMDNQITVGSLPLNNDSDVVPALIKATKAFETSITLRKNNYAAHLNMVTAYDLLYIATSDEDYLEDARYWLRKASRLDETNTERIGFLSEVIGVRGVQSGATSTDSAIPKPSDVVDPSLRSAISGDIAFTEQKEINGYILEYRDNPNSTFYRFRPPSVMTGATTVMFEAYNKYYQPSPSGIYVGATEAELLKNMGEPEEQITDGPNTYYGYETRNIIFRVRDNKVTGWVNYRNINAR
jgi:tetratricopeptide (TPR) repeat protein